MTTPSAEQAARPPGIGARLLKIVAAITAVITLVLGAHQVITRFGGYLQHSREATTLTEVARQQAARGEFADAWTTLERAAALSDSDAIRTLRLDVAFAWLQEGRPGPGKPFRTITDVVVPALDRALIKAEGGRRADILAHLGWATFLKLRDGVSGDPAARYHEALAIDTGNVYANAMLGHWLMWRGAAPEAARERFAVAQARATAAQRPVVRRLQLAALMNQGRDSDAELLRVADDMRQRGESPDVRTADRLFSLYVRRYGPAHPSRPATDDPLPPPASLAVFDWLVTSPGAGDRSPVVTGLIRSALQEVAGDRAAALRTLRDLRAAAALTAGDQEQVDRAIARLDRAR